MERCHYCREPGDLIRMCQKRKGIKVNKGYKKAQMQHIVEVAEGNWLDPWPHTMQGEGEDQMDTVEA